MTIENLNDNDSIVIKKEDIKSRLNKSTATLDEVVDLLCNDSTLPYEVRRLQL